MFTLTVASEDPVAIAATLKWATSMLETDPHHFALANPAMHGKPSVHAVFSAADPECSRHHCTCFA